MPQFQRKASLLAPAVHYLRDIVRLDNSIGQRLEQDHNWSEQDRKLHATEVDERKFLIAAAGEWLKSRIARSVP